MDELIRAFRLLFRLCIVLESLMERCPIQQVIVFLLLCYKFDAAVVGLGNFAPDCFAFGVFCFELILLTNYRRIKRVPLLLYAVLIYWAFINRNIWTMLSAR